MLLTRLELNEDLRPTTDYLVKGCTTDTVSGGKQMIRRGFGHHERKDKKRNNSGRVGGTSGVTEGVGSFQTDVKLVS